MNRKSIKVLPGYLRDLGCAATLFISPRDTHKRRKKEQRRKMKVHKQDLLHLFSDLGYPTLVTEASLEIEVVRERVAVESQFVVQEAMTLVVATMHLMDGRVPCEVGGGMCVVEAVDTSR